VLAVDRSIAMTRVAATTLDGAAAGVVVADLLALPLARAAADVFFSTATFHWIHDHPGLFREIARVLRPGGRLHAQCGGGPNIAAVHGIALEVAEGEEFAGAFDAWEEPWNYAWPEQTKERLRAAGFTTARAWLEPAPTQLESRAACASFIGTVILRPWLSRLPEASARERFVGAVTDRLGATDPPWLLDYWRLNIEAAL
jgi:trans-aconitate 2-methyltransferase